MGGSTPDVPPPVETPKMDDPEVEEARRQERLRMLAQKGRQSTILTGGAGLLDNAPTRKKTLLGE